MKKLCSMPGCGSEAADSPAPQFIREVGIVDSATWKKKHLPVLRSYSATCPTHGEVTAIGEGHHCNDDSVEYEATEDWQLTAVAEMMLRDQQDFISQRKRELGNDGLSLKLAGHYTKCPRCFPHFQKAVRPLDNVGADEALRILNSDAVLLVEFRKCPDWRTTDQTGCFTENGVASRAPCLSAYSAQGSHSISKTTDLTYFVAGSPHRPAQAHDCSTHSQNFPASLLLTFSPLAHPSIGLPHANPTPRVITGRLRQRLE